MDIGVVGAEAARRKPWFARAACMFGSLRQIRSIGAVALSFLTLAFLLAEMRQASAADPPNKASTAKATRDEAVRAIPLAKLSPDARAKVNAVLGDTSLYRRLPLQTIDCEPDLFQFVATNPDAMVNIWELMGVTNVSLERIDPDHYRCSDGDGTTAKVEMIYRAPDMQIIYGEGSYDGPLFPKAVHGSCVAVLKYVNVREPNGRYYETARLDTFLHVDNMGVEILAKIFQGLVGRTIDHNFAETIGFIGSMSRTAEVNPRGMQRLIGKLDQIETERKMEFAAVASKVPEKLAGKLTDVEENPALAQVIQSSAVSEQPAKVEKR